MEESNRLSLFSDSRKACMATRFFCNGCTLLPTLARPPAMRSILLLILNFLQAIGLLEFPLVPRLTLMMEVVALLGPRGSITVRR